ncbi:MAG: hypothetical protein KDB37_14285 [Ilumatobacter sp.]|nr:hypothetical protein [Ilumatobacter sp.]
MLRRHPVAFVLVAPLVAAVGLTACGGDDESSSTTVAPVVATIARVEIPDSFPDDVPLPGAIELEGADEMSGGESTIYDITGWNSGEPVPLGEAYLAELREAGFEITSRVDATNSILFTVESDDWFVSAGFYPDAVRDTGTSIGVTVGPIAAAP